MADYDDDDELFKDLYGDEVADAQQQQQQQQPQPQQPRQEAPPVKQEPPQQVPQQQYESAPENGHVERAIDPRRQPSDTNVKEEHDPERDFAHNGGGQWQEQNYREEKDTRPNPNKHEDGKMFIGGLNWETTDESLRAYFEQFGEITECTVMRENQTGRSRGFGFLTFKDPKCVNVVMVKEHILDGKIIDPKRAIPRDEQDRTSKIFVGGIGQDVIEEEFKDYFEQFGTVLDATLMMDKETGRPRGFGFVTFDDDSAVENCMAHGPLAIKGKMIEVKRAQPKGREREIETRRPYERDRNFGGGGGGGSQFPGQNGFNGPQAGPGMMNPMYGGMSPALMAQWYQRMQAYYATMGRGMMPAMGMGNPMMGMPNMQGMQMGGMPPMQGQMMGMNPNMGGGYQGVPMNQGYQSPPPQQSFQQETSHEGEYTYDTGSEQAPQQQSPPPNNTEIPSGPREGGGPPPNAPTGPSSGVKPSYGGGPRGRGMMRGGRGFNGGSFPGGMARGGNVRYNPYSR